MFNQISRRTFARLFGSAALAPSILHTTASHAAGFAETLPKPHSFPRVFCGGRRRLRTRWRARQRRPRAFDLGHVLAYPGQDAHGDTGDVADDYYHRYKEDIAADEGAGAEGVAGSRWRGRGFFPTGTGTPNQKGLDFYKRMVGCAAGAGIEPYCTLFHWDLPQALAGQGRMAEHAIRAKAFADYCGLYGRRSSSDRVKHFMTMNEMRLVRRTGLWQWHFCAGAEAGAAALAQVRHYAVLGHGMAVQAIRARCRPGRRWAWRRTRRRRTPVIETAEHIAAARKAMREENAALSDGDDGGQVHRRLSARGWGRTRRSSRRRR